MSRCHRLSGWIVAGLVVALPALGAGGEHGESESRVLLWQVVNFVILVSVLVYFGRGQLREMFASRRSTIAADIETAASLLERAEAHNSEWQRRLADLDRDIDEIRDTARRRAEDERERILAEANEAAERIQRDAVASVEQELRRAQGELREEAASLATELAAGMLREQVGQGDRDRLVDEFISRVGSTGSTADPGGR